MNVAIFTPSQNPYSETFIKAHKLYLKDDVFYYYGNLGNMQLEGGTLFGGSLRHFWLMFKRKVFRLPGHYVMVQKLKSALRNHGIDVILVEYGTQAHHLMPLLEVVNIPFVVHFHGYDASRTEVIKRCDQYRTVFKKAFKIVAVSKVMQQGLRDLGCPESKLVYNVYGPRPEFHDVTPNYSKAQFISIGRFTDKKAPYYTILAFKRVLQNYPNAKLLMAGDGDLLGACKNLVRYYKIDAQVRFLGVIPPESYRKLLSESLAYVQHSITASDGDMEGTPLSILEASASGLPVISTNHAGIPDVIAHNETGLLCDEHDVGTMARHMEFLLGDIGFSKQLGLAGKQRMNKQFNLKRHIKSLQAILNQAVSD